MAEIKVFSSKRRVARFMAIQMCYSLDMIKPMKNKSYPTLLESISGCFNLGDFDSNLLSNLINLFIFNRENVDSLIESALDVSWSISRLDIVVLSILRMGVTELVYVGDAPGNVVINEYVDIVSASLGETDSRFVNAVLDKIYRDSGAKSD